MAYNSSYRTIKDEYHKKENLLYQNLKVTTSIALVECPPSQIQYLCFISSKSNFKTLVKMPVRCNGSMRHIIYCFLLKFGDELIYIPDNITYFNSV